MFGDSASAHFHIPVQWLQADKLNKVGSDYCISFVWKNYLGTDTGDRRKIDFRE